MNLRLLIVVVLISTLLLFLNGRILLMIVDGCSECKHMLGLGFELDEVGGSEVIRSFG